MTAPIDVLVVGGGMYVCGRGDGGWGTIGPALFEGVRAGNVGRIAIATTSEHSATEAIERLRGTAAAMGVSPRIDGFPSSGRDSRAYLSAAAAFQPTAAIVSVPDDLHAEVTCALCELGIHCQVVKPLAPDLVSARRMVDAARRANVLGQVEFHKRHDEANLLLRDAVVGGSLGTPLYAVIEYSQPKRIPRDIFTGWAHRTSIFQYLGVHYVDLLQFVTGFLPERVIAWGQKGYLADAGVDTWDAMQVVIEWRRPDGGRFVSTHATNWIDPDGGTAVSDQTISLVGTGGRFDSDQKHRGVQQVADNLGHRDVNPYFSATWQDPGTGRRRFHGYGIKSVLAFIDDVIQYSTGRVTRDSLSAGRPTFEACLVSTAVIEAAHRSLAHGSIPVSIPSEDLLA